MECSCFSSSTLLNSTSIVKFCTICTLRRYYMSQFEREKLIWCILHNLGLFESQISCEFLGNTSLIEHQNNSIEHENSNCYIFATVPRSLSRYCRRQERKMQASPRCQGGSFPRSVVLSTSCFISPPQAHRRRHGIRNKLAISQMCKKISSSQILNHNANANAEKMKRHQ